MNILVVGAGALGGYYGARLIEAGKDVTFLLRPNRIKQLEASNGLQVSSTYGNVSIANPRYIQSSEIQTHYDLIIISCKAYDLDSCMDSFAAAVGEKTTILPFLNGIGHINKLITRFGKQHVLGGLCRISATLDKEGHVLHLNHAHDLIFGEISGESTPRIHALSKLFENVNINPIHSNHIMQAMWDKWVFIATVAGINCLFHGAVCDIVKAGGSVWTKALLNECAKIAEHHKFKLTKEVYENVLDMDTDPNSTLSASMFKDLEKGKNIEAEAIIGDFVRLIPSNEEHQYPMLRLIYTNLLCYLARRDRENLSGWN